MFDKFPMPNINERRVAYYGESSGYLHLVQVHNRQKLTFYNIYEMNSDGTEWYMKYQVNVEDVVNTFPHMIRHYHDPTNWNYLAMSVLCVVRGKKEEEEAFMILHIPKMVISYNLRDNTFYKLHEFGNNSIEENQFEDEDGDYEVPISLQFDRFSAFQYVESLFCM
ncbi:hypothetical protein H5410_023573 [Solanum commersonii]|uniref:Uncharacterized protein n=1 Tax=Solanum commersonii TaxID=4109 RepID=A0A9J5ZJR3_SOLCO|nr:hypothetical protein H5410_023573 [Solanum commersonii]